ncbi:hypothetical protein [Mycobacterium simiae]|uniref:hypothetical protein n=1 Tax=Mycobacterium simiae TaxID=1784 RepID=UPI0011F1E4D8|nr:hypothetical protein [Mycobacterium simiae]
MVTERIRYAVVCCSGQVLAYLNDDRPVDGQIGVEGVDEQSKQTILAADVTGQNIDLRDGATSPDIGDRVIPYKFAASKWGNCSLTETRWPDWHVSWTINCDRCSKRVEMRDKTLVIIADGLAAELDKWLFDADGKRYVLPLGVLNLKLTRLSG